MSFAQSQVNFDASICYSKCYAKTVLSSTNPPSVLFLHMQKKHINVVDLNVTELVMDLATVILAQQPAQVGYLTHSSFL